MDELKLLIDMVKDLPTLAVWVLVGFLGYKLVVIGSVFGVVRLLIIKVHDLFDGMSRRVGTLTTDSSVADAIWHELVRLRGDGHLFIHMDDVVLLRNALDIVLAKRRGKQNVR